MGRRLEDILEMQFRLSYYKIMSISEHEELDLKEIDWFYGRLIKQTKDEHQDMMRSLHGKSYTEQLDGR